MNEYNQELETLYNGSKLDAKTFADFKERLTFHSEGEGVDWHYTSDALFVVQSKVLIKGLMPDYTDKKCIHDNENCENYYSMDSFVDMLGSDGEYLEHYGLNDFETPFLEMSESEQWDCLDTVDNLTISGWAEDWKYVNAHFTKEAAQRFIDRKKHDYRSGMRIYVHSQYYAWEFNAIKNAIMNGDLVFKEKAND